MQQVARYERRLWDRNSALMVPGKTFARAAQLAREALYEPQRRPEPARSASRPSHRVRGLVHKDEHDCRPGRAVHTACIACTRILSIFEDKLQSF